MVLSRYPSDTGRHFNLTGRIAAKLAEPCFLRKVIRTTTNRPNREDVEKEDSEAVSSHDSKRDV